MKRKYTKVQQLAGIIVERKAKGEMNREIGESLGLSLEQVKELVKSENRRKRRIAAGYKPQPRGRRRKSLQTEMEIKDNAIVLLKMENELLRNFLSEAGRK